MVLTANLIYRQAVQKARLLGKRNLRAMLRGERDDSGPPVMDLEREFIIRAIERAAQPPTQER